MTATVPGNDGPHLVDSSIWIPVHRRKPPARLESRLRDLLRLRSAAVNEQIELEILIAYHDRSESERVRDDLQGLVHLSIVRRTWDLAANLGFDLRRLGIVVATPDLLIAASAIEHDAVLVHADSDFDRIGANSDLRVESYAGAAN